MADTSGISSAVPSDGLGARVADAAALRATSVVVIVVQDTRQAQQLAERMKALKARRHQLNRVIRNAVRRRARLLQRSRVLQAIMKVVAKRTEETSRAVAKAKAKAKAAAQVRITSTLLFGLGRVISSLTSSVTPIDLVAVRARRQEFCTSTVVSCSRAPRSTLHDATSTGKELSFCNLFIPTTMPFVCEPGYERDCSAEIVCICPVT